APGAHHLFVAGHDSLTRWDIDVPRGSPWSNHVMTEVDSRPTDRKGIAITPAGDFVVLTEGLEFRHADGHVVRETPLASRPSAIALTPDGGTAVVGDAGGNLTFWDVGTQRLLQTIPAHKTSVLAVAVNAQGDRIASAAEDDRLEI